MKEFVMLAHVQDSIDLPGYTFIRLEFSDRFLDGPAMHIMENHVKPRSVSRWIAAQIRFVRKEIG